MKKPRIEDFDPNTSPPPLGSPLDNLPTIKPPQKEANLAPVAPPEQAQTDQPAPPPSFSETPQQMERELARPIDGQPNYAPSLLISDPALSQSEETKKRTNVLSNEPSSVKRQKIRHTFDIYADQLLSLKEIQLLRARALEKHYRLGDLVQEALDGFITKERNKE
jgi:hypothetical protein